MDLRRSWLPACVSALIAVAVYANTPGHGFVVDDIPQIKENAWLEDPRSLPTIFSTGVWDVEGRLSSYYRPFMYTVYLATTLIAGKNPFPHHLVSVLLHAAVCALAALVAGALAVRLDGREAAAVWCRWFVGIGFAVHPIHSEAVAWIASVPDLGFALFALLSLSIYLSADGSRSRDALAASAYLGALLFKETAIGLPLMLFLTDALRTKDRSRWIAIARRMVPFAVALGVYVLLRVRALGALVPLSTESGLSPPEFIRTVVVLAGRFVRALVWPFPQCFWHTLEIPRSFLDVGFILAVGTVGLYVAALGWSRRNRLAFWGLLAVLPPLLPALALRGLNQGVENAFAERYLYVPSFGFLVAVAAAGFAASTTSPRARRIFLGMAASAAIVASIATWRRNAVWHDHVTLWRDAVTTSPRSAIAQQNLGFALLAAGRAEEGKTHLRRALELRPDLPDLARAKAEHYERVGLPRKAVFSYLSALTLRPEDTAARWGLARQYVALGWKPMAEAEYGRVLAADPSLADAQNELGILLAERGDLAAALERFDAAARLRPGDPDFAANAERARRALGPPR